MCFAKNGSRGRLVLIVSMDSNIVNSTKQVGLPTRQYLFSYHLETSGGGGGGKVMPMLQVDTKADRLGT